MQYQIKYARQAIEHLRNLSARQRAMVLDAVDRRLSDHPSIEARNRKLMRPNPLAVWELRVQNLRVYYDVDEVDDIVFIHAIGVKSGNVVFIGGEELIL